MSEGGGGSTKASSMTAVGSAGGVGGEHCPGMGSGGRLVNSTSDDPGETMPSVVLSSVAELCLRSSAEAGNDDKDSWLSRVALVCAHELSELVD